MKYIDLFGGIGGFRLGIEKATGNRYKAKRFKNKGKHSSNIKKPKTRNTNWECVWYCDNDKYAVQTYNKNFKENYQATDIREVRSEDVPVHDFICAGFPCQSFSIAGKRLGFNDTRGTLFYEILRIARHHHTKYLFLENVKGLLSHDKGRTFATILASLDECGYNAQWQVLNSKYFGVPQNRERIFIIANLRTEPRPEVFPIGINAGEVQKVPERKEEMIARCLDANMHKGVTPKSYYEKSKRNLVYHQHSKDEIREFDDSPTLCNRMGTGGNNVPMVLSEKTRDVNKAIEVAQEISIKKGKAVQLDVYHLKHGEIRPLSTYIPQNLDEHRCLQSGEPKEILIQGNNLRRLTPVECARLQGFPDKWHEGISDTQAYKQYGNAVTVNVIEAIIKQFLKSSTS